MRKFHLVMRSAAAVFFPRGFGTHHELFELEEERKAKFNITYIDYLFPILSASKKAF